MTSFEIVQLVIQVVAVAALLLTLYVYHRQLRTMAAQLEASRDAASAQGFLALINFLQAPEARTAREIVRVKLREKDFSLWTDDESREASRVCSTYDVAAIIVRMGFVPQEPFVQNWGSSIRHCFEVTRPLIKQMQRPENSGPSYWNNFEWLYQQVVQASVRDSG